MMGLDPVPDRLAEVCAATRAFVETSVYPQESTLSAGGALAAAVLRQLQDAARAAGLWGLGLPPEYGGSLELLDFAYVSEEQGRSEFGAAIFGSVARQDVLTLAKYGSPALQRRYLDLLVTDGTVPSLAMTEPQKSGSDPMGIEATGVLEGGNWRLNGHKWFVTGAAASPYTTFMCRTEPDARSGAAFSLIAVPNGTPGVEVVRETLLLGLPRGHAEVRYTDVLVPEDHLVGGRGQAMAIAQERLAVGRLLHAARWVGQGRRALDMMAARIRDREVAGGRLSGMQLAQQLLFDSFAEVESCHLLMVAAARALERGSAGRVEVGVLKVVGARMQHSVLDRALQIFGAEGLTDDTPLSRMSRVARFGRIYDGPDEVHIVSVARRLLRESAAHAGTG
jgi:acyl-CoA dehydrogenase